MTDGQVHRDLSKTWYGKERLPRVGMAPSIKGAIWEEEVEGRVHYPDMTSAMSMDFISDTTKTRGIILCSLLGIVVARLIYQCVRLIYDFESRGGPKVWPILGTTVEHLVNHHRLHDWLLTQFQKSGKSTLATPVIAGQVFYYTVDPVNIKHMLKTNFSNYPKGKLFHERMESLLGDGIFNIDGDSWRSQRKTASVEFSLKSLKDFSCASFKEYGCKLAGLCARQQYKREAVDMQDLYMRTTLDSIGKIGFGMDLGSLPKQFPLQPNEFATAFDGANEVATRRFIDPFWKIKRFFGLGGEGQMETYVDTIDKFVYTVLDQRKREYNSRGNHVRESEKPVPKISLEKSDIISRFLDLSVSGDQGPMSDKFLRDVVLNFIIAGRDTTAVTMTWMTYMLIQHQDIAYRLWEELVAFQQKHDPDYTNFSWTKAWTETEEKWGEDVVNQNRLKFFGEIMDSRIKQFADLLIHDSLKELIYLHAVISETLRLYPAVPLDPKFILKNDVLPDGTKLKAGQTIAYSPWCMGRMTSIWGPDALEFNPDRWIQDGDILRESEYKFATFQAGYRTCLGRDSAYLQIKITMAIMCRFFEFTPVDSSSEEKTYRMMATLGMAGGLQAQVRLRN
ncbi:hypothetical protein R1sor_023392 [Riccia sorocarpa]|uniref:Cytochrome P450 n=1 Tax=Riccia sorocarpa TaxID=122646 RepID=A0ABD3GP23_9MARC